MAAVIPGRLGNSVPRRRNFCSLYLRVAPVLWIREARDRLGEVLVLVFVVELGAQMKQVRSSDVSRGTKSTIIIVPDSVPTK